MYGRELEYCRDHGEFSHSAVGTARNTTSMDFALRLFRLRIFLHCCTTKQLRLSDHVDNFDIPPPLLLCKLERQQD